MTDRLHSAAAERNRQPIVDILRRVLPPHGHALEIASGSGQHVVHFAAAMPGWTWQPTDADPAALASIAAWCAHEQLVNVRPPLALDVMAARWPLDGPFDAIFCANLLHIAPWPCCAALMRGAAQHLSPAGLLVTYGPYLVDGQPTALSNLAFDAELRARDPQWGLRRLEDVAAQARQAGLVLREQVAMPANNLTLVFERAS
jgi:hypothetical protein